MQAEYQHVRGNGFIISPPEAVSIPSRKYAPQPSGTINKLSGIKDSLKDTTAACTDYAKSSGKVFYNKFLSALVALCCILSIFHFFTFGIGIYCNGTRIASVDKKGDFITALAAAKTTAASYGITDFSVDISASPVISLRSKISSVASLRDKILLSSDFFIEGCSLYANNVRIFSAESPEFARAAVKEYISAYSMDGNATLSSELTYKACVLPKSGISSKEECIRLLSENDSVNVVSVVNVTSDQVLPFETHTENDSSLYVGEYITVTEGKNGNKQVSWETVYENGAEQSSRVFSEKITAQPVNQVVRVGTKYKKVLESGLFYPLKGVLSSPFGQRWGAVHEGIDIAVDEGTPVKAAECGIVSYVSENAGGYGKFIRIEHGYGVQTAYAHLSEIQVTEGQSVSAGTVIGLSGNTGKSTGPHLHFEITQNDIPVDPLKYLK